MSIRLVSCLVTYDGQMSARLTCRDANASSKYNEGFIKSEEIRVQLTVGPICTLPPSLSRR